MQKLLVAGASGYLGRYMVMELKKAGYWVRVLVRDAEALKRGGHDDAPAVYGQADEVWKADLLRPETMKQAFEGMDGVFSAVGMTRQKGTASFMDIDYQANLNLLKLAEQYGAGYMMYVHAHGAEGCKSQLIRAKQRFVEQLKNSPIPHLVIQPTGYYSDMSEMLKMARKGTVYLIGKGEHRMNPIHGRDLAAFCVQCLTPFSSSSASKGKPADGGVYSVGGPEVYTYRQMAELARESSGRNGKIVSVPVWLLKSLYPILWLFSRKRYHLLRFFLFAMTHDVVAPTHGSQTLEDYYQSWTEKGTASDEEVSANETKTG
ncbi:SDR family oxidoreductase [Marinicrinis sediminis]|uniref:SDR family oxidoreductase n=1 Tax=Marinicrinis sediminis TaxID=1652465 RepID=A0ABW5R835_9BACL